ncbi:MAG: hypothetical protein AB7O38_30910, partial [Pirellulaceae bacterium]
MSSATAANLTTSAEFAVLRALTLQVRVATADQVARGWFAAADDPLLAAQACLAGLEKQQLTTKRLLEAHPMLPLSTPLFSWKPGQPQPTCAELENLAAKLQARWSEPNVAVEVYLAAPRASRLFGAFVDARHLKHCEVTHDLHLTEAFLGYCASDPRCHQWWWGEAAFPKIGQLIRFAKDPDAFLLDSRGGARRVVEFAGTYDAHHLHRFH